MIYARFGAYFMHNEVLCESCLSIFQERVADYIDPYPFAYRINRAVEDIILHVLNTIYSHLENPGTSIRLTFYEFSSIFNTIHPPLLTGKLMKINVDACTVL